MPLKDLKPVTVPQYPEVSVKVLYDQYKDRQEVIKYFPSNLSDGRTLDRTYFFNILNTFIGDE